MSADDLRKKTVHFVDMNSDDNEAGENKRLLVKRKATKTQNVFFLIY